MQITIQIWFNQISISTSRKIDTDRACENSINLTIITENLSQFINKVIHLTNCSEHNEKLRAASIVLKSVHLPTHVSGLLIRKSPKYVPKIRREVQLLQRDQATSQVKSCELLHNCIKITFYKACNRCLILQVIKK